MWRHARTLAAYLTGIIVVLLVLNGLAWALNAPRWYGLSMFSVGFVLGAIGMYLAAYLYGYRRSR